MPLAAQELAEEGFILSWILSNVVDFATQHLTEYRCHVVKAQTITTRDVVALAFVAVGCQAMSHEITGVARVGQGSSALVTERVIKLSFRLDCVSVG